MKMTMVRNRKTKDGLFGVLVLEGGGFQCFTCENLATAVLPGTYSMAFTYSPRFNRVMPLVNVPNREGIRLHWGNFPSNYEGCIGVGNGVETDSIDNTVATFNQLYALIKDDTDLSLTIEEEYA